MAALINGIYLSRDVFKQIKDRYSESGMIVLHDFFDRAMYDRLKGILKAGGEKKYVADRFSYEEINGDEFLGLFRGEFRDFIKGLTGRDDFEVRFRKFSWKDYTLIHDEVERKGADFFFFVSETWKDEWGGYKVYVSDEPMIFPVVGNALCVISREGMNDFVKYLNNKAEGSFVIIEGNVPAEN
ncbi:hypothetical protein GW924_01680 [Candidatus Pacearchaeota archaeon]|nr:hypothetical protein [Candidatus Pacearchaeota archaeon]